LPDSEIDAVIAFWSEAGPKRWFTKHAAFDTEFRSRFFADHQAAAHGELDHWADDARGALALVILLDQFPRNAFRGTARMYATDHLAREVAARAIAAGFDLQLAAELRLFFYLPYAHSESLADQDRSVELSNRLGSESVKHAIEHRAIIRRFGRFPHRNEILGRATTTEEQDFLDAGGFAG
jgi:uncharacterized protein (DUF924 family)